MPEMATVPELAALIHRLQAVTTRLTMRATELISHPANRRVAKVLATALRELTGLGDYLGQPQGVPSTLLVAPRGKDVELYGYITLHPPATLGGYEALFLRLSHSRLSISAGRLEDGRPYVHVHSDDLDESGRDPNGLPYLDVDLDTVGLYEHRVGRPAPTYHSATTAGDST